MNSRRDSTALPLPVLYGERVGVRGCLRVTGDSCICGESPSPGMHLAMHSDLSPHAGRGKAKFAAQAPDFKHPTWR
ncbi:hypothetical protein ACVIHH_007272 [Bradyrhizobium sp. USDA 4518]|nr:hypothetical protein [Bradyrhizobium sp. USDA 4541]MCP1910499.1 hypothetical protein [Bradyrhizobium elkanii]